VSQGPERWRVFLAVELPAAVMTSLMTAMDALAPLSEVVRTSPPEGIHLTLHFLGHLELDRVDAIHQAVEPVIAAQARFGVEVEGLGAFPSMTRPRVVWAGLGGADRGHLLTLQSETGKALRAAGFELEDRAYAPHLTLGRVRRPPNAAERRALQGWQAGAGQAVGGRVPVEAASLIRSELGFRPTRYTTLRVYPLK
jgi:2'-5' RNA ligase